MVLKLHAEILVLKRKRVFDELYKGNFIKATIFSIQKKEKGKADDLTQVETLSACIGTIVKAEDNEGNVYTYAILPDEFSEFVFLSKDYARYLLNKKREETVCELERIDSIINQLD